MDEIRTANRGEWSELYALLKLLAEGKLYPANDNLDLIEELFYPVTKITTNADSDNKVTYAISSEEDITIQNLHTETVIIKREAIKKYIERFFGELTSKHETSGAFPISSADEIMELLKRNSIAAASFQKADLILEIYDTKMLRNTEQGYSIKSQVGGLSTLFNSSKATNMLYSVEGIDLSKVAEINAEDSCRKRVEKIYELGGKLSYLKNDRDTFSHNLSLVDSNFSRILAEAVLLFNKTDKRKISDIVGLLPESGLNLGDFEHSVSFYKHNFRKFLFNSALGMVADKKWDGLTTADGGIIVVKKNGSLAGYNPGSLNKFQDYLYDNTKFDTPSSRNEFGTLFEEEGKLYMKLNFQIRFAN